MKKSLIAMAALAATGAFAQSSVTLYGRMDLGMAVGKADTTTAAGVTTTAKATELAGAENNWTGSRLGVRGSEDLGGGLKANFAYEFRLAPDATSAAGVTGSNWGRTRTAMLQVAGGFGSVTIGTYSNPFDDMRFGAGIYGAGPVANIPGAYTLDKSPIALSSRSTNAIGYRSPLFAGGFFASVGTTLQNVESSATVNSKTSGYIGSVGYGNGPISALAVYGQGTSKVSTAAAAAVPFAFPTLTANGVLGTAAAAATSGENRAKDFGLRASYDLGVAVPYIQYENVKATSTNLLSGAQGETSSRGYEIGSTFPMGAFTPYILFANNKFSAANGGTATGSTAATSVAGPKAAKTTAFQLGTKYDLSKRTFVYGGYGASATKIETVNEVKSTGFGLGLVHNF